MSSPRRAPSLVALLIAATTACAGPSVGDSCADAPCFPVTVVDPATGEPNACFLPNIICSGEPRALSCCDGAWRVVETAFECQADTLIITSTVWSLCGKEYALTNEALSGG